MWRSANLIIMNMMLLMLLIIMKMMLKIMINDHDNRDVYDDKLVLNVTSAYFTLTFSRLAEIQRLTLSKSLEEKKNRVSHTI